MHDAPVASIRGYIQALEAYALSSGARLVRSSLPASVHGRVCRDIITLRVDLDPEQELKALVHELAHWLAHRDLQTQHSTVFEYEAEAVEALVMSRIGFKNHTDSADCPTDDLLSASVVRVKWASNCICDALDLSQCDRT